MFQSDKGFQKSRKYLPTTENFLYHIEKFSLIFKSQTFRVFVLANQLDLLI